MQILCKASNDASDACCGICGQRFVISWERTSRAAQTDTLRHIQQALRDHHVDSNSPGAHPQEPFHVPDCPIPRKYSRAALLGGIASHSA